MSSDLVTGAPLVSISMTAFNSERWLARALDSVLLQQTDFPVEIVIGDDCSTDGTVAVARSYRERHPGSIRVIERSRNVGMQRNYYETFEQCRGKFIAWLDADDYWTDPQKLAVQVRLMESDPSVKACGHFALAVTTDGVVTQQFPSLPPGRYGLQEIIRHSFLPSPSIMFRNGVHRDLPSWYFDLTGIVDWPILVLAALSGEIVLLDEVMADYMLTPGSAYTSKSPLYQNTVDAQFCEKLESILPAEFRRSTRSIKGKLYESIAYSLRKQGDFTASREAAVKAFRSPDLMDNLASKSRTLLLSVVCEMQSKLRHLGPAI